MISIGPYRFTETDARRTLGNLGSWWVQLTEGRDATALAALEAQVTELAAAATAADPADLAAPLERAWTLLHEAGRHLRDTGQLPAVGRGAVAALHRSDGGVPKQAVETVDVDWRGVVGDRQAARVHHGRPWQALCLWSVEVIGALRDEGHQVFAGAAGENVTISGLDWSQVRAGVRLRLGTVLAECSMFALPCAKNARWFIDGEFNRMHHDRGPWSRVYATVLEPGRISVGDEVVTEP